MVSLTARKEALAQRLAQRMAELARTLSAWPWLDTLRTLRERFREDRLGLTASSLTFTTLIALVPLVTVMLAVFSAFPMFASFQSGLENYFLQALVPDNIARPVLRALTQFAAKARDMGSLGLALLVTTAIALMLTIDRTLNAIWRVRRPRPLGQRVLVYWAALTLGPLVIGVSLTMASYALSASKGLVNTLPGGLALAFDSIEFALVALAMAGLYHYMPNTSVRWRHAWAGALFVAVALELAKKGLAWYVATVPGISVIYGAFATLPILLLWIYLVWVIVLLGAVIAAYAPSLQMGIRRPDVAPGSAFELALQLLRALADARGSGLHGLALHQMAETLRLDPLHVEATLETLMRLDWVARLDEEGVQRHVLLCEPASTPAGPLVDALLLRPAAASASFREAAGLGRLTLAQLL
ncbi:MAG: YihY family inner membrane protein [Rubrivivax sp.]|nr:YihY family inner membrane protein [Rubrivivax sp.]